MNQSGIQKQTLDRGVITDAVELMLGQYCHDQIAKAQKIGSPYVELWNEIDKYLQGGGKRIRPYLMLLTYEAYGGAVTEKVLPVACAWELLHSCLLVHDDIIDRDTIRHGSLNIAGQYETKYKQLADTDAGHYASSAALLAGDLLLSATYDIVMTSSLAAEDKLRTFTFLHDALFSVGGGELLDVESVLKPIESVDTTNIAIYKTARYSFELPMLSGAVLADAGEDDLERLSQLGKELGLLYQLIDDILGVFGDVIQTGKPNDSDIREKKRTPVVQYALKLLDLPGRERLTDLYKFDRSLSNEEVSEITKLIHDSGAREMAMQNVALHTQKALDLVELLTIPALYKKELQELIDKLQARKT